MKIISKEKAWIGFDEDDKLYCFEESYCDYIYSLYYNDYYKLLSDITVNDDNQVHSFNDQPLIYKDDLNRLCKVWFINGERNRLNPEKPCLIIKGFVYYFNDGSYFNYRDIRNNLR